MKFTSSEFEIAYPGVADLIKEVAPSPKEHHGANALTASIKLTCPWEHRFHITDDIVGGKRLYPRMDSAADVRAQNARILPFSQKTGEDEQALTHDEAELVINYSSPVAGSTVFGASDSYSESIVPSGEFQTISPENLYWIAPGGSENSEKLSSDEAPGLLIIGFDYTVTLYGKSTIPLATLSQINHCNTSAFASPTLGVIFNAETLLFTGSTSNRTVKSNGSYEWTITNSFSFRSNTWNRFFKSSTGTWENIKKEDGSDYKPIPTGSFSGLLPPAAP